MTCVISGYAQKYVIFFMEKFRYEESLLQPFLTFNCSYTMVFYTNTFECGFNIWLSEIIIKFDA